MTAWSWKIVSVELSNFLLLKKYLLFSNLGIFRYEKEYLNDSSICSRIDVNVYSFCSYFPRKFTEINSSDVNCMFKEQFPC